jgi:hypothetical protein
VGDGDSGGGVTLGTTMGEDVGVSLGWELRAVGVRVARVGVSVAGTAVEVRVGVDVDVASWFCS